MDMPSDKAGCCTSMTHSGVFPTTCTTVEGVSSNLPQAEHILHERVFRPRAPLDRLAGSLGPDSRQLVRRLPRWVSLIEGCSLPGRR